MNIGKKALEKKQWLIKCEISSKSGIWINLPYRRKAGKGIFQVRKSPLGKGTGG